MPPFMAVCREQCLSSFPGFIHKQVSFNTFKPYSCLPKEVSFNWYCSTFTKDFSLTLREKSTFQDFQQPANPPMQTTGSALCGAFFGAKDTEDPCGEEKTTNQRGSIQHGITCLSTCIGQYGRCVKDRRRHGCMVDGYLRRSMQKRIEDSII